MHIIPNIAFDRMCSAMYTLWNEMTQVRIIYHFYGVFIVINYYIVCRVGHLSANARRRGGGGGGGWQPVPHRYYTAARVRSAVWAPDDFVQ